MKKYISALAMSVANACSGGEEFFEGDYFGSVVIVIPWSD